MGASGRGGLALAWSQKPAPDPRGMETRRFNEQAMKSLLMDGFQSSSISVWRGDCLLEKEQRVVGICLSCNRDRRLCEQLRAHLDEPALPAGIGTVSFSKNPKFLYRRPTQFRASISQETSVQPIG